jgi:hypothetical protein
MLFNPCFMYNLNRIVSDFSNAYCAKSRYAVWLVALIKIHSCHLTYFSMQFIFIIYCDTEKG